MADVPETFDDANPHMEGVDLGAGSEFWLAAANGDMTELAGVLEIPFPGETDDLEEVSHMKSPNRRKQYINGWVDGDEADVTMLWVPGSPTDTLIREARTSRKQRAFRIVLPLPDGKVVRVTGFVLVRAYKPSNPMASRREATMTIKFTGAFSQAAPAAVA